MISHYSFTMRSAIMRCRSKPLLRLLMIWGEKSPIFSLPINLKLFPSAPLSLPEASLFLPGTGAGLDKLKSEIRRFFDSKYTRCILRIPYERMREYGRIKGLVEELSFRYDDTFLEVKANVPNIYLDRFAQFCI